MAARKAKARVSNPSNALRDLAAAVKRGLPKIVFVVGESDFFRARAVARLLEAVPDDADLRSVDGNDVKARPAAADDDGDAAGAGSAVGVPELMDLRGGGLFASRVVVVVRRASAWWTEHAAAIAETAARIQDGSTLIVEAPTLDKRKKVAATLFKQVQDDGFAFEFRNLRDRPYSRDDSPLDGELCRWLVATSKDLGVALSPESAWLIITHVGLEPGALVAEVERLRDLMGSDPERPPLGPKDLTGRLTVSFSSTQFEFAEAVLAGDRKAAMRSLHGMFAQGIARSSADKRDAGGILPMVTSWLYGELCKTWEGRLLLDKGVSPRDLPAQAGVRAFQDRFVAQVRQNDLPKLRRGLLALHACQRKSRLYGERPELLLEQLVAQWFDGAPIETAEELEL